MRFVIVCMLVLPLLSGSDATAQTDELLTADEAGRADGQFLIKSAVYPCDGTSRPLLAWQAAAPLTLTHLLIWIGTDGAGPGQPYPQVDTFVAVYVSRPHGYILGFHALDRYAAPSAPHDKEKPLAFRMAAGEQVGGGFSCVALFGAQSHVQVLVIVSYTKDPP